MLREHEEGWGGERDARGGGRVEKGRSEQQGMTDDTDASSVTPLHLAPVLRVHYERLRCSRLCSEGAGRDRGGGGGGRIEEGRSE